MSAGKRRGIVREGGRRSGPNLVRHSRVCICSCIALCTPPIGCHDLATSPLAEALGSPRSLTHPLGPSVSRPALDGKSVARRPRSFERLHVCRHGTYRALQGATGENLGRTHVLAPVSSCFFLRPMWIGSHAVGCVGHTELILSLDGRSCRRCVHCWGHGDASWQDDRSRHALLGENSESTGRVLASRQVG